jgi:phospholipase/lecithinase/hemolysin
MSQVQDHLASLGEGPASGDALYVFFAGGDIVQPALSGQDGMDNAAAHANARQTADDLVALVAMLADSGAVSFTVLDLFDMARVPIAPFRNPLTTALCRSYNEELAAGLAAISGARVLCFDFEAWMASISPHFEVTDALFLPGDDVRATEPPEEQSRRADSNAYLFFDGWGHLSGRANQLLGKAVMEAVVEHMPPMR